MAQTVLSEPKARENLFRVLLPEAVPNRADKGRTAIIVHKTICLACRETVAERRHPSKGTAFRESMQAEAHMEAESMTTCEHCGAINLSAQDAAISAAEPESTPSVTQLS